MSRQGTPHSCMIVLLTLSSYEVVFFLKKEVGQKEGTVLIASLVARSPAAWSFPGCRWHGSRLRIHWNCCWSEERLEVFGVCCLDAASISWSSPPLPCENGPRGSAVLRSLPGGWDKDASSGEHDVGCGLCSAPRQVAGQGRIWSGVSRNRGVALW